jgi:hypothetical protein
MADYLTAEAIADLTPTLGDLKWAQREIGPEADLANTNVAQQVAYKALHRAAKRAGLAGEDEDEFFDRLPINLTTQLMALLSLENPTKAAGAT